MWKTKSMLCLTMMCLSACGNGQGQTEDYCSAFHAIYPNKHDNLSIETKRAILQHDETGHILCGWDFA